MSFLANRRRRKSFYSVDKLRILYADLIQHIDVENESLGRRAIDEDEFNFHRKSMRFALRRKLIPESPSSLSEIEETRDNVNDILGKETMSLLTAFRALAATKSPDKEGDNLGAISYRDDDNVAALACAKRIEVRVATIIRDIGDIVVNTDITASHVRGDSVFEYFCEKSMLSLLVDIAKEKKQRTDSKLADSSCHGVVWTPLVKAQCYQTTSLLLSDVRNNSVVYYLLSHNYMNDLITCMLPIKQWTDPALAKMMPAYVDLLKNITLQLTDDPSLFPFLIVEDDKDELTKFPLLSAALEVTTSAFAQSDSEIYGTCLAVVVNLMKIQSKSLQMWIADAGTEQKKLADHLCKRLLDRYHRVSDLTTGPVVDVVRSNAILCQLSGLRDHIEVIQEVFWTGVKGLDVRLCEALLRQVISVLLKNILPRGDDTQFLDVGVVDADVIPHREALAQTSIIFLSYLFSYLTYTPFKRMLAVAVFHPASTPLWLSLNSKELISKDEYTLMPALSDVVNEQKAREEYPNLFRDELLKGLRGQYGDWRFISTACLFQTILDVGVIELDTLELLHILPAISQEGYKASPLEQCLVTFFEKEHLPSRIAASAMEGAGYLAMQLVISAVKMCSMYEETHERLDYVLKTSEVWKGLTNARTSFSEQAMKCKEATGVSDIFLDLVEAGIKTRYFGKVDDTGDGLTAFTCLLSQQGCAEKLGLVRRNRNFVMNDVETCRFYINLTLHFRALRNVIDSLYLSADVDKVGPRLDLVETADFLTRSVGGLSEKVAEGTDLDLTGRMTFRFEIAEKSANIPRDWASDLKLVLDPTDLFVVNPRRGQLEENRSTMLCSISLRSIIAAASDREWLHVAVRHEDVKCLIKNGNMALRFENPGTSLIVKQYLDRSREVLRQELQSKAIELLT